MLNWLENLAKCGGGNNELIDQWLQASKGLLVAYYYLIVLKPNKGKHTLLNEKEPDVFCHPLVNYLSAGHFHVYIRIVLEGESSSALTYSGLNGNTQERMALYDSHLGKGIDHDSYLLFQEALSGVGEALATRFILEEQLI